MKHITLSKLCIFSTLMIMNNSYTMRPTKKHLLDSIKITIDIALGKLPRQQMNNQVAQNIVLQDIAAQNIAAQNIAQQDISQSQMITQPINLSALPKDIEKQIMSLAIMGATAGSLQVAAHTINSLAQVNHSLNEYINDPVNCLDIIKTLAKKFNCADITVCEALKTKRAKIQSNLQQQLYKLCINEIRLTYGNILPLLTNLATYGADFNFSYEPDQTTPLMICIYGNNDLAYFLLDMPQVDLELADVNGITPLIAAQDLDPANPALVEAIKDAIMHRTGNT